jgi:predicted heme/steroid binding protein
MERKEYTLEELLGLTYNGGTDPVYVKCTVDEGIRFNKGKTYKVYLTDKRGPRLYTEGNNQLFHKDVAGTNINTKYKFEVIDMHRILSENAGIDDEIDSLGICNSASTTYYNSGTLIMEVPAKPFTILDEKGKDMSKIVDTLNNVGENAKQPVSTTKRMTLDLGTIVAESAVVKGLELGKKALITGFCILEDKIILEIEEGDVIVDTDDDSVV